MIEQPNPFSLTWQCKLLGLSSVALYYRPVEVSGDELELTALKHEVSLFNFSPQHQWFYFPHMEKNEALLIKCFVSLHDGRARLTAHTTFDDHTTPPNVPLRESIEVGPLVLFAPEI